MSNKAQKICIYNRECRQRRPKCSRIAKDSLHGEPTAISLIQFPSEDIDQVDRSASGFRLLNPPPPASLINEAMEYDKKWLELQELLKKRQNL